MKKLLSLLVFITIPLLAITNLTSRADLCRDYILLDGMEKISLMGLDTTNHWWAITQPFENKYRIHIDGEMSEAYDGISSLTFSPDGSRWAYFAQYNARIILVTNDTSIALPGDEPGEIVFSPNSNMMAYSYKMQGIEMIHAGNRSYEVMNRLGRLYLSPNGERLAFLGRRAGSIVVNMNGQESMPFDTIAVAGYWYDGKLIYAAKSGNNWQVYKGNDAITENYAYIKELNINREGNVAGFLARMHGSGYVGVLISDDYYEPLISKRYDAAENLALHPQLPMYSFNAVSNGVNIVVLNGSEYIGGKISGRPLFSYDGSELFFLGCDTDCFLSINGKRYPMSMDIDTRRNISVKPKSRTLAYATSSSLVVRYLESKELFSGMMVDMTSDTRYNWREDRYEALGIINNKLYLLTCRTK